MNWFSRVGKRLERGAKAEVALPELLTHEFSELPASSRKALKHLQVELKRSMSLYGPSVDLLEQAERLHLTYAQLSEDERAFMDLHDDETCYALTASALKYIWLFNRARAYGEVDTEARGAFSDAGFPEAWVRELTGREGTARGSVAAMSIFAALLKETRWTRGKDLLSNFYTWDKPIMVAAVAELAKPLLKARAELDTVAEALILQVDERLEQIARYVLLDAEGQAAVSTELKLALEHYKSDAHAAMTADSKLLTEAFTMGISTAQDR